MAKQLNRKKNLMKHMEKVSKIPTSQAISASPPWLPNSFTTSVYFGTFAINSALEFRDFIWIYEQRIFGFWSHKISLKSLCWLFFFHGCLFDFIRFSKQNWTVSSALRTPGGPPCGTLKFRALSRYGLACHHGEGNSTGNSLEMGIKWY